MNLNFIIAFLLFSATVFAQRQNNDTIFTKSEIRILYKSIGKVDSARVLDLKFKIRERGLKKDSLIFFYNTTNKITAIASLHDEQISGNMIYYKNDKIYKVARVKNWIENGISMTFDINGKLETFVENRAGKPIGLSIVFDNGIARYLRTGDSEEKDTTFGMFDKSGKLITISFPNEINQLQNAVDHIMAK